MAHRPSASSKASRVPKTNEQGAASSSRARKNASPSEPFHLVTSTMLGSARRKERVPTLTLRGAWLKAAGFPIGSDAYVIVDRNGELALHRSGLRYPRTLRVIARRR